MFFGTVLVLSVGYATFTALQSSDAGPGKSLTSTMMQTVIGNLSDLDSRISGISSTVSALQVSAGNIWNTSGGNISYTGGNVGIGTVSPSATLEINDQNNAIFYLKEYNDGDGAIVRGFHARGSIAAPSPIL